MKNKQIYQDKHVLWILATMGVFLSANPICEQIKKDLAAKRKQEMATVIQHHSYIGANQTPVTQLKLDTDGNKETTEAICEFDVEDIKPLSPEDLKKTLPVGTKRTIWEWKKLGRFSTVEHP